MINLIDKDLGINILFEGTLKGIPRKIGFNEIVSIRGKRFTESVRGVIDCEVRVLDMSEDAYKKIVDIFLYGNVNLEITDLDTGKSYKKYYITGDTFNLDEKYDYDTDSIYYQGGFSLNRR